MLCFCLHDNVYRIDARNYRCHTHSFQTICIHLLCFLFHYPHMAWQLVGSFNVTCIGSSYERTEKKNNHIVTRWFFFSLDLNAHRYCFNLINYVNMIYTLIWTWCFCVVTVNTSDGLSVFVDCLANALEGSHLKYGVFVSFYGKFWLI